VDKIRGTYYMRNNTLVEAENFTYTLSLRNVYEVIRLIQGIPLFLEEHLERMEASLNLLQLNFRQSRESVRNQILTLAKKNRIQEGNVKILINDGPVKECFLYFIPHHYPEESYYRKGIRTMTMDIERKNPNAKVIDADYKNKVTRFIKDNGIYEALIVNSEGEVTEGSKSNVFFIEQNRLITPPLKDVLGGVTRKRILAIAGELGIESAETAVTVEELRNIQGAFISGTSPKILPIASINDQILASMDHPVISTLIRAYDEKIEAYIHTHL